MRNTLEPATEQELRHAMDEANRVRDFMGDPIVEKVFSDMERDYKNEWANSLVSELEKRENAYRLVINLRLFRQYLLKRMDAGLLAHNELRKNGALDE